MKFETFCDYLVFPNGIVLKPDGTKAYTVRLAEHMVKIKDEWYSIANLLASLFLPYKEGCDYVEFKDGDKLNFNLDNLYLTDQPVLNKIHLTKEQRASYVKHITAQDLPKEEIDTMIYVMNGGHVQGERAPIEYAGLDLLNNKSGQFAPVVEVMDVISGCHVMTGSAKEIHEKLGVNVYDTYKGYSQGRITKQGYAMTPLALVPKQYINAQVIVRNKVGMEIIKASYCTVCQMMNLHYESLSDILNYGTDEPVEYCGYTFEILPKGDN